MHQTFQQRESKLSIQIFELTVGHAGGKNALAKHSACGANLQRRIFFFMKKIYLFVRKFSNAHKSCMYKSIHQRCVRKK